MLGKIKLIFTSTRFKVSLWYSSLFFLMEILLGLTVYVTLNNLSHRNLDSNLKTQARAILRVIEEKHVDLESFKPGPVYKSEDEVIWDIAYDAIVFNRRNTFIVVAQQNRDVFKTANLGKKTLSFPERKEKEILFDYRDKDLSTSTIRVCRLSGKRYVVTVAYPKEFISQTLNDLITIYIIIAPIFLIISIIGGALISSKSLARIDTIIKKTEEITAQNLNEKIPGDEYNDEFGRLVNKMNEMIGRIKTSVDFMNQFSISAAHELKTPLTILRGEIEIALKSEKAPEYYRSVLKSNYEETLRLIKIVDNLFFISKSDNSLLSVNKQEIDLYNFLNSLIHSLSILGSEKNMLLVMDPMPALTAWFDENLMKQALSNIVENAFKFGEENSTVKLKVEKNENEIIICVSNRGERIPPEETEKIFERFYRTDKSVTNKIGGVGLGLSVVKSIANLHNGRVGVSSGEDSITTISIIIPEK